MSIMLLCSSQVSVPPEKSGAIEIIVYELAKYLQRNGENVSIVSRKSTSKKIADYVIVDSAIRSNKLLAIIEDLLYGIKCIKKIRAIKPDILHMHTTFTAFPIMLFREFLPKKTKIVYTSHSPAWTVPDKEIGVANRVFNRLEGFVIKKSNMATAVADSMRSGMISRGIKGDKVITIENFTQSGTFSKSSNKSWKIKNKINGPVVLFVGKLTETKGIPYLLKSVKKVAEKFKNVKFVLVGGLEHEQDLKENPWIKVTKEYKIENNVYFAGTVPFYKLPEIYSSADVFVLPSLREGMPLVVMEAITAGLPVIATKVSGTKEVLNRRCAVFVRRKNSDDISKAIIYILSNKKTSKIMSQESIKLSKKFDKQKVLNKYLDLYNATKLIK